MPAKEKMVANALLTTLSMESNHLSTLLTMDTSSSSHEEAERELNRAVNLLQPPDINVPLSAEPSPPPPSWDACELLEVGIGPQHYELESHNNVTKIGKKCAKRLDSVWGAWFFFSFYFKPALNEKSKGKVTRESNGVIGYDKSDLKLDVFLVQHDMENMYMWVFKDRPENALGKMQLRSYMNGHSRQGERPFPFSADKGFRQIPLEGLSVAESIWPKVIQMHRLHHSFCFNAHPLFSASLSLRINQKTLIIGIGWNCCKGFLKRRKSNSLVVSAVEKESDFEVDPVKAREALRKLDEQLQTLAQKKVNSPKVRASDVISTRDQTREGTENDMGISGTLITSVASGLIIFTIFYNFLFLTVIKPAIDGPEPIEATTSVNEAEKAALSEQFSSTRGTSVEP